MIQLKKKFENLKRVDLSSGSKIDEYHKSLLLDFVQQYSTLPTPKVLQLYWKKYGQLSIGLRQVNRLRSHWGLSFRKGRPLENSASNPEKEASLVQLRPNIIEVGVHLFDVWGDQAHLMSLGPALR